MSSLGMMLPDQAFTGRCAHWDRWGLCMHAPMHPDNRPKAVKVICSVNGCGASLAGDTQGVERHYQMIHDGLPRLLQIGPAIVTLRQIR